MSVHYWELLEKGNSALIHHQNIKFIAIEIFKVFSCIGPKILKIFFQLRHALPHQLRKQTHFQITFAHNVFSGI